MNDANIILTASSILLPLILRKLSVIISTQGQDNNGISEAIERHLTDVIKWATYVQFFGMSVPKFTDTATIDLNLYTEPRKFQSVVDTPVIIGEQDLIAGLDNILMLGEPGSGKTTTFKRIALTILREQPTSESDIIQYPIVIRLREMRTGESLYQRLSDLFGLVTEPREIVTYIEERDTHGKRIKTEIRHTEIRVGNDRIEDAIPRYLNDSNALLLLDGLDELAIERRDEIRDEVLGLSRRCVFRSKTARLSEQTGRPFGGK